MAFGHCNPGSLHRSTRVPLYGHPTYYTVLYARFKTPFPLPNAPRALPPPQDAIKTYAAATGLTSADLSSGAGQLAVTGHVIPNAKLLSKDFPQGATSYETVAGNPITVMKRCAGGGMVHGEVLHF